MAEYTFQVDRDAGTWACFNANGTEIANGELPLESVDRRLAIFADAGVSDPTARALERIWKKDWEETDV